MPRQCGIVDESIQAGFELAIGGELQAVARLAAMRDGHGAVDMIEQYAQRTSDVHVSSVAADQVQASAGATGERVATASAASSNIGQVIALRPHMVSSGGQAAVTRTLYQFNGQIIAQRSSDSGGLIYLHGDHLGSVSLATSSSGTVVSRQEFDPWGGIRSGGISQTTINYTGQRRDGTGLLYYHARYYDPVLARFVSADAIIPEPKNPQALNRYAYVHNNPLRFIDPSGHCRVKAGKFEYAEDCTADEFDDLSWDHRLLWLDMFTQRHDLGDWFNDIRGAIEYLRDNADFSSSPWASYADAVVLQAIQNGMRLFEGKTAIGAHKGGKCNQDCLKGASGWLAFYQAEAGLRERKGSEATVIRIRLLAEQLGVDYAWKLARPLYYKESIRMQIKIDVLKWATDQYRAGAYAAGVDPRGIGGYASELSPLIDMTASYLYTQYLAQTQSCRYSPCY